MSAKKSRQRMSPTSRMTDFETSVLEMRNSLLHLVEESIGEKKQQTHRLMCMSKFNSEVKPSAVGEFMESSLKEMLNAEDLSGLLLIFPMHCVHILEGTMEQILEYLRTLHKQTTAKHLFAASRLLVIARNITTILFQNWMYHILDIQATGIGDYESTEPTENLMADMVVNLTKLGVHLSKQPKLSYNSAVQALHEKIPECLPQQDMLEYFLEKQDPALQNVAHYLRLYDQPYKVTLTSETVWPMPDHLMPSFS